MRIFIQSPNINSRHGGIRVINEWANRLEQFGHTVYLFNQQGLLSCNWMNITCKIINNQALLNKCDCLIVTSPHGAYLLDKDRPAKKFIFLQMLEHLFNQKNNRFYNDCMKLYQSKYPLISISQWNIRQLQHKFGRKGITKYVGNGINLTDFPIVKAKKNGQVILLESPEPTNDTKDVDKIAVKVAYMLKEQGYLIKGYGIQIPKDNIYTEYIVKPDLTQLNRLYEEATIMIKATKYDARSTSPLEAMTKGTVTVRGIIEGDDDLNDENSYKTGYSFDKVLDSALFALNNKSDLEDKARYCRHYVQNYTWDYWMNQINKILIS